MKNLKIKLSILLIAISLSAFISCREKNTGESHSSESGSYEESGNPADESGTQGTPTDSTSTGTDNSMPAQSSDTVGNNQGTTAQPATRP